jgi:type II secretory pathway predicted ATPase ExeA
MFESFYGFTDNPFRMSTDVQFRFAHRAYVKAWSHLNYALEKGEGFVLITGRPGTGKTTLIHDLLSELDSDSLQAVSLVSHQLQGEELLRLVALELGFPAQDFNKAMLLTRIEQHALMLHKKGRRIVIIVDEAQNLTPHGLEELRLLSNLQADNRPLFQIVLIGQEELRDLISSEGSENIRQRIVTSCQLEPMRFEQIQDYVEYRLGIVGWDGDPSFDPEIYSLIYRITHGVAREINLVIVRLLLYGALENKHAFNRADLLEVLDELQYEQRLAFDQTTLMQELEESTATEAPAEAPEAMGSMREVSEQIKALGELPDTSAEEGGLVGDLDVTAADTVSEDTPLQPEADDSGEPFMPPVWNESETDPMWGETDQSTVLPEVDGPDIHRIDWDNSADELPVTHTKPVEVERKPQGLYVDVGDISEKDSGDVQDVSALRRWIFYPLATVMLLITLLVPKPGDLPLLWNSFWQQLTSEDEAGNDRQSVREGAPSPTEDVDKTAQTASVPISQPDENDTQQGEESQKAGSSTTDGADEPAQAAPVPPSGADEDDTRQKEVTQKAGDPATDGVDKPVQTASVPLPQVDEGDTRQGKLTQKVEDAKAKQRPATDVSEASAQQALRREKAVVDSNSNVKVDKNYFLEFQAPNNSLDDRGEQILAKLVVWLHKNPTARIAITGILTNGEKPLGRMREALLRAEQISARLVSAGISSRRIFIEGGHPNNIPDRAGVSVRVMQ